MLYDIIKVYIDYYQHRGDGKLKNLYRTKSDILKREFNTSANIQDSAEILLHLCLFKLAC